MALEPDQRAMLQLLLERGQSYEDIASLLGVDSEEARSRARAALAELGGRDPDEGVALTDYLLGQADPIGRADAVRYLASDDEALDIAIEIELKLRALAPEAELPSLPERRRPGTGRASPEPGGDDPRPARPATDTPTPSEPTGAWPGSLSSRQSRALFAIVALAVIVIVAALAVSGTFSGDDDAEAGDEVVTEAAPPGADEILSRVQLEPQGDTEAAGEATFGIAGEQEPYIDLSLDGLSPTPRGSTYVLWLLLDGRQGFPLTQLEITDAGSLDERLLIPTEVVPIAAATRQVDVSLTEQQDLADVATRAVDRGDPVLRFTGESILRGKVPAAEDGGDAGNGGDSGTGAGEAG